MIKVNIGEAKTHLSHYLERVERGETVVVCRRNEPIAEIRKVPGEESAGPRPLGLARQTHGPWKLPPSFFEPLPDGLLDAFGGG